MQVIVQLKPNAALAFQHDMAEHTQSPELRQLQRTAQKLGVELRPMHPGTTDPLLAPFFVIETSDEAAARHIVNSLIRLKVVEAAYLKPPDELP